MTSPTLYSVPHGTQPRTKRRRFVFGAAMVLMLTISLASRAGAYVLADVDIPDTYNLNGHTLVLNGAGLRTLTLLKIKAYIVALYLPKQSHDPEAILASPGPKVLVLYYIHSGTKEQVQDRYREGERVNCGGGGCDTSLQGDFDRLVNAVIPVSPGDKTTYVITDKTFRADTNGHELASFNDPRLGNMIINGFIGPHAPSEELRAGVLGLPPP